MILEQVSENSDSEELYQPLAQLKMKPCTQQSKSKKLNTLSDKESDKPSPRF